MRRTLGSALATVLLLAGCGGDEPADDTGSEADHNAADVAFATDMVQHHAQALVMVDLTVQRPVSRGLADLAEQIRAAQGPEIEQLTDLLEEWDEPVPETIRDHANAHGGGDAHADHDDMPGMQSQEDLDALAALRGPEFEEEWLDMMIDHHEGAIEMAETELAGGESEAALLLARQVAEAQEQEVAQMERMVERVEDRD